MCNKLGKAPFFNRTDYVVFVCLVPRLVRPCFVFLSVDIPFISNGDDAK